MGREGEWQSRDQTGYNGDLEKNCRNQERGLSGSVLLCKQYYQAWTHSILTAYRTCYYFCLLQSLFLLFKKSVSFFVIFDLISHQRVFLFGLNTQKGNLKTQRFLFQFLPLPIRECAPHSQSKSRVLVMKQHSSQSLS